MEKADIGKRIKNYQPNQSVLAAMADIRLMATIGPSAVGKTTLMEELCRRDPDFKMVIDETTRPKRIYETDGVDFLFRGTDEVLADLAAGKLVQAAIGPNGHIYSTRLDSYPKNSTGLIALVPAAVQIFRGLPIKELHCAFIVPPSWEVWQNWLARQAANSDWSQEQFSGRLEEARRSFEFALKDPGIRFILNDEIEKGVQRLADVARGQAPSDEEQARQIARALAASLE